MLVKKLKRKQIEKINKSYQQAAAAFTVADYAAAEQSCLAILTIDSSHVAATLLLAKSAYSRGDKLKAKQYSLQLAELTPLSEYETEQLLLLLIHLQLFELGLTLAEQAVACYPNSLILLQRQARLFAQTAQTDAAIAYYQAFLVQQPTDHTVSIQLATLLRQHGQNDAATVVLQEAYERQPNSINIQLQLAICFDIAGELTVARALLSDAIQCEPSAKLYTVLGWVELHAEQIDAAYAAFNQAANLQYDQHQAMAVINTDLHRLLHDYQQLHYLKQSNKLVFGYDDYFAALSEIHELSQTVESKYSVVQLKNQRAKQLVPSFNQILYRYPIAAISDSTLNSALDFAELEHQYLTSSPQAVVIDALLRADVLAELREFCLASTVWKQSWMRGYVGAMMDTGFANPLLLKISEDLRQSMPRVFQQHRLFQCWAFKYDSQLHGINLHADFAAVNVNFWITPDTANLDHDSGGLVVWDVPPPTNWDFADYNRNEEKCRQFLNSQHAQPIRVPHRQNRALLFDSALFHETDQFQFRDEYCSRRINITMLYGQGLRT